MPRDDLSIDFVKKMPLAEPMDPAVILDDWFNRVQNLPDEIRFIQDEIRDKDRHYAECLSIAEDRDAKMQKWYKNNGSHMPNPKEEALQMQVRENYQKADKIAAEKLALSQRLQTIMDKHLRALDVQLKLLYDRAEPGFTEPDEVPSLLRPSAANKIPSVISTRHPAALSIGTAMSAASPSPYTPTSARPSNPYTPTTASVPASPAAPQVPRHTNPANAPNKRPRLSSSTAIPPPTSALARHSATAPGTPKSATPHLPSVARPESAGPRTNPKPNAPVPPNRKSINPPSVGPSRKKSTNGPSKSRQRKAPKAPASNAGDSELSDASGAGDISSDSESVRQSIPNSVAAGPTSTTGTPMGAPASPRNPTASRPNTPVFHARAGPGGGLSAHLPPGEDDDEMGEAEYDESGDNKKYCRCQKVSFGDMVACDNDDCPYEWFHWSCVGLRSEPNGKWCCPDCRVRSEA